MPAVGREYTYPDDTLDPASFAGISIPGNEAKPDVPAPSLWDTAAAAFRQNSDIVAPLTSQTLGLDTERQDPGFNLYDELKGTPYENRLEFVGVRNRDALQRVKMQIDQEDRDRSTLDAAGVMGDIANFGAGFASWTLALPGGALVKGAKGGFSAIRSAAMVGTAAAAAATASEATLQASQVTRPTSESVSAIGGSFLLGGVLGGIASKLSRQEFTALTKSTEDAFKEGPPGAAVAEPETGTLYGGSSGFGTSSAGAAAVERGSNRLKDEGMFQGKGILAKPMKLLNSQDPMIRLQLNPLSEARTAVRDLAETPLELQANREGFATSEGGAVETRIKMWNAPLGDAIETLDDAYGRYFLGKGEVGTLDRMSAPMRSEIAKARGGEKMTFTDFKEAVGRAMSGDDTHPVPEVQELAQKFRETVFERGRKEAIEAGVLDKSVGEGKSAGYLTRVYNKAKIIARRGEFKQKLNDYLERSRVQAEQREAELTAAKVAVQIDEQQRRLNGIGKQLTSNNRRIAKAEGVGVRTEQQIAESRNRLSELRAGARNAQDRVASQPLRDAIRRAKSGKSLALPKSPVLDVLKARGGVEPGSPLAQELIARGVTKKTHPGLFRKADATMFKDGSRGAADNIVGSEHPVFADNFALDENGYVDPEDVLSAVDSELAGEPLRTFAERDQMAAVDGPAGALRDELEHLGISMDLPEDDIVAALARADEEAGRYASFDDIPMIEVPEALSGDAHAIEDFYTSQTKTELDARYAEMRADIAKRGEAVAMADPKFAKRYQDAQKTLGRLKDTAEARKYARTVMRRDMSARAASWQKEADALSDLMKQFDEIPENARAAKRVSIARDYATVSRDLAAKKAEQARILKQRESHALVNNTERLHEMDGRLRLIEPEMDRLTARHTKLSELVEKTGKGTEAELKDIADFTRLSPDEIDGISDEVIDTILGNADGRMVMPNMVVGERGPLKARTLRIPDQDIEDFLERDIEAVARIYTRTMSADVELARKFGSVDMSETIKKINDEANALISRATKESERIAIEKQRKDALRDVNGIRDRIRGNYALPNNPDGLLVRSGRVARNLNFTRLLGGAFISAFSDVAKPVFNYGLTSVFRDGFLPMVRDFKAIKMAGAEARAAGTALEMQLDSRAMAFADVMDDYGRGSKFERVVEGMSSKFGVVSMLAPWTDAVKQFSSMIIMNNMLRAIDEVAAGTATAKTLGRLGSANISAETALKIAEQFKRHGKTQKGNRFANTADWTDRQSVEAFRAMLVREVDKTIVTVGQDKPLWMSTETGKLIGQFKSFGVASVQKTLFAGLQQRDAATLNGTMMMLGLGLMSHLTYSWYTGREIDWDPKVLAANALDKSGVVGWLMDANNMMEKITQGRVGLSAVTGKEITRYESRNAMANALGPSLGLGETAQSIVSTLTSPDPNVHWKGADTHKLRQLIPFQNLFYVRSLFDKAEIGFNDAMGIEQRDWSTGR